MSDHEPSCPWAGRDVDCPLCRPLEDRIYDNDVMRMMRRKPGALGEE